MKFDTYENPLITRYATKEMASVFSERSRIIYFRKLWVALAEAQKELGLNISDEQIEQMKKNITKIDFKAVAEKERETRHDVMAHIYAYGVQAPLAKPIIHLGATSCFVTDNADILVYRDALNIIKSKLITVVSRLKDFAQKHKDMPCLGYTHLQPAQLTTVGKRAALWMQDLYLDFENLEFFVSNIRLRGVKGTTGTQASFLELFDGDIQKVKELEAKVCKKMRCNKVFALSGQTYTRKFDYNMLSILSQIAQSAYKFSNDLRLLQHMKEIEEPFEKGQVGSSAMAYKRNPMRSERISSLARYAISLPQNAAITASTQWLERTLDDSANRRIVVAQAFLTVDAILNLYSDISQNMVVYPKMIQKHIAEELPFMATENILMECVKAGGDRQSLHEKIRQLSIESGAVVKLEGKNNDLLDRIVKNSDFAAVHNSLDKIMQPSDFIGCASSQTEDFIDNIIMPLLQKNKKLIKDTAPINV